MNSNKKVKIKWLVDKEPTGLQAVGYKRRWPTGVTPDGEDMLAQILCDTAYSKRVFDEGIHGELKVLVLDHNTRERTGDYNGAGKTWFTCKKRATTLKEAKDIAVEVLTANPDFLPKGY